MGKGEVGGFGWGGEMPGMDNCKNITPQVSVAGEGGRGGGSVRGLGRVGNVVN